MPQSFKQVTSLFIDRYHSPTYIFHILTYMLHSCIEMSHSYIEVSHSYLIQMMYFFVVNIRIYKRRDEGKVMSTSTLQERINFFVK